VKVAPWFNNTRERLVLGFYVSVSEGSVSFYNLYILKLGALSDAPMVSVGVHFKDVLATSVVVCWKGRDVQSTPYIQGYQLWHHKVSELGYLERPTCTLPRTQRRALVSNLEPSTDYIFKVSLTDHVCNTSCHLVLHCMDVNCIK